MKILILLAISMSLWAMEVLDIVDKVNARDDGQHVIRKLRMELIDKRGKKRVRETVAYRKYFNEDKKSVIYYKSPKRLRGTGFLTFENVTKDDEQWLYLPSIRKVRRISSADRGDWFLGTDFSYEDIKKETKLSKNDYNFKLIKEEKIDAHDTYVLEQTPKNKDIIKELGYSRLISWIDKEIFISRKTEYYDERGELLKTLLNKDIKEIDSIWTIHSMNMKNHQNNHISNFYFSDVDYKTEVKDKRFTKKSLKRRR